MSKKTFFTLFLSLFLISSLEGKVTKIDYKATFGIFGTVGMIKNTLTQTPKRYTIDTKLSLSGLAKTLLGNQGGHYISKGHFENGLMVSDLYQSIENLKGEVVSKEYWINHKKKYVTKKYKKWVKGKLVKNTSKKLKFYAKDDLLSFYFNMNKHIKNKDNKKNKHQFLVVGLEKQKGKVKVTVPYTFQRKSYKKDLGETADWYAKAFIHQKNFRKKKGDVLLSVSKDGYIKSSVIKDILLYGDARLERIK